MVAANFDALECLHIVLNYPISYGLDCGLVKFPARGILERLASGSDHSTKVVRPDRLCGVLNL